ncbi:MAG: CCA tRNA nucleotidyltransferase [Bacteroidales bacterium]|jgi:poly(A) polymerase|nr:CCA tRNA nucleotidyltransferase [Bacteroidales bacterium]
MDYLAKLKHPVYALTGMIADEMGVRAYAVGGVVRDIFLNRSSKDIDIVVVGSGIELATAVARAISPKIQVNTYKNFGTAQFTFQDAVVEFVGARRESYNPDSRKPVVEDGTLEDDQNRRDFTINALAISLNSDTKGNLIDSFGGMTDIENKIIRTPLDPNITFSDDPLRMMRAVRFASQLNFTIWDETFQAIQENAERLDIISRERIVDEFNKILLSPVPSRGIILLEKSGLLEKFLPELLTLKGVETIEGRGHKDNYYHTLEVVDKIRMTTDNIWLIWAALLHDIAKPKTKRYSSNVGWTFHGHEVVGVKMAEKIFKSLKMPINEKLKYVKKLISLHLRPIALVEDEITDSAVRRLLFDAGDDIDNLMLLCEADVTSKNQKKVAQYLENFAKVRVKLKEIEEKDRLRNWQPPVDGELIMRTFGLPPSRKVGIIKTAIREAILDGIIENTPEAAIKLMMEEGERLGLKEVGIEK